jgi:hypothetical protein
MSFHREITRPDAFGPAADSHHHRAEPLNMALCAMMAACLPLVVSWADLYATARQQAEQEIARRRWVRQWVPSLN